MFLQKIGSVILCVFLAICLRFDPAQAERWQMVHGEVLQVFAEQQKVMLLCGGARQILVLEEDCPILRYGAPTGLASLRPVADDAFQDVLCWINPRGLVSHVLVNYSVREEYGVLVGRDIFGNVK